MNFLEAVKSGKKTHRGKHCKFYMQVEEVEDRRIVFRDMETNKKLSIQYVSVLDVDSDWEIYEDKKPTLSDKITYLGTGQSADDEILKVRFVKQFLKEFIDRLNKRKDSEYEVVEDIAKELAGERLI